MIFIRISSFDAFHAADPFERESRALYVRVIDGGFVRIACSRDSSPWAVTFSGSGGGWFGLGWAPLEFLFERCIPDGRVQGEGAIIADPRGVAVAFSRVQAGQQEMGGREIRVLRDHPPPCARQLLLVFPLR